MDGGDDSSSNDDNNGAGVNDALIFTATADSYEFEITLKLFRRSARAGVSRGCSRGEIMYGVANWKTTR